jgi:protein-L-isoaspartate(D-aspartate) O-methyltransferase
MQDPGEVHRGGCGVIWQHPGPADERLLTRRLELAPVVADDAEQLAEVFGDERLYVFLASRPTTTEELRAQFDRLAVDRLVDMEGTAQRNWTVRRRGDGRAVGMLQAAFSDQGRAAEIAWAVGVAWQGQGIASEAARAVVGWLERRGVTTITAHIHPDHHASAAVATRAGLRPTGEYRDHEGIREQLWHRRVEGLPPSAHPPAKEHRMPTAEGDRVRERLAGYAAALHAKGAIRSQAVQRAFASVRRDRCLTSFHTPDGTVDVPQGTVPTAEVLDRIYSDQALVTHFDERGAPVSSSSQPALVAEMLEALELAPGMRVLEVGAGTGYNAALLTAITGAPVVTLDTNQRVVEEARATLGRLGLYGQVTVVQGDGYDGWSAAGPYDRIIVTCGCVGLSPRWLGQLAPSGLVLIPVAHGGVHPIMAAWHDGPTVRGRMVLWADFMEAAGPLGQQQPAVLHTLPAEAEFTSYRQVGPVLDWEGYAALWCFLAARDHRITRAATLAEGIDPTKGMCALHDPDRGIAWIQMDGSVHVAGAPALLEESARLLREWETLGQPPIQDWRCTFAETGPASAPILTPRDWSWARPLRRVFDQD